MPKIVFILRDGARQEVQAEAGKTILQTAWDHKIPIEGACEGCLACSTCHVIVDGAWAAKLPEAGDDETDMLDLAYGVTKTSRLGCQIKVTEAMDGLVLKLPGETRSLLG